MLNIEINNIPPQPEVYDSFVKLVQQVSRQTIPKGCRTHYIAGLSAEAKPFLVRYQERGLFYNDPFAEETFLVGEELMSVIAENRKAKWCDLVESLDMQVNSRQAWKLLKNLNGDSTTDSFTAVTADKVAANLLLNGKTKGKKYREPIVRDVASENEFRKEPFTFPELTTVISSLMTNRAPGIDEVRVEHLRNFGENALQWLLNLMNACEGKTHKPKAWRKARVAALSNLGKIQTTLRTFDLCLS